MNVQEAVKKLHMDNQKSSTEKKKEVNTMDKQTTAYNTRLNY